MKCVLDAWHDHEAELLHFVQSRLGNGEDAHDLVQEIFLKAMKQPNGLCGIENRRAWLFHVARNLLIDRYRLQRETIPFDENRALADEVEWLPVEALAQCLPRVLSELAASDREAISRCDIDGLSLQDYAAHSGLSLAAAKARLRRARKRLRERLVEGCRVRFDEQGKVCCFVPRDARDA